MATQLLIYETAVPVNRQRHRNWSVKTGDNYGFARSVNSVPLTAVEFMSAAAEYPIVFSGTEEVVMPAVILGLRNDENAYLTESGSWQATYIPAFVRRYPFVFSSDDDGKRFTLCIDEQFTGCNEDGRGERLFDSDGERTQYLTSVLSFQQEYQAQFQRTRAFCDKLKELDLLEPMQAMVTLSTGEQASLAGFMGIQRERLKALSGEQLSSLARTDELELAYLHLHSLRNFSSMAKRVATDASDRAAQTLQDPVTSQENDSESEALAPEH